MMTIHQLLITLVKNFHVLFTVVPMNKELTLMNMPILIPVVTSFALLKMVKILKDMGLEINSKWLDLLLL